MSAERPDYRGLDQDQPNSYDCVPTATSMGVDGATAGVKRPDPKKLREAAGVPYPRGMSYLDMEEAVREVCGMEVQARFLIDMDAVVMASQGGHDQDVSIDLAVTAGTDCQTGNATSGGHTLSLPRKALRQHPGGFVCNCDKHSTAKHPEFVYQDPGTWSVGYRRISGDLLEEAMLSRNGDRGVNALVFPDTTDVYRRVVLTAYGRQAPSTKAKRLRRLEKGRLIHVIRMVQGEKWLRSDGKTYSTAWYLTQAGDYVKGDRLSTKNEAKP